jgi:hypothetical protein
MNVQGMNHHDSFPPHPLEGLLGGRPVEEEIDAENRRLRAEVQRLADEQRELMQLLDCKSPDRLAHDLRNVLNELNLYRTLMENNA